MAYDAAELEKKDEKPKTKHETTNARQYTE